MSITRAFFAAILIWTLGVSAYVASFSFQLLENPDVQANIVLLFSLVPITYLGASFYYRKGFPTHGFKLGAFLFGIAMLLDAAITVPVFIIPAGGNHLTFFTDPGFWIIAVVYISVVVIYWRTRVAVPAA